MVGACYEDVEKGVKENASEGPKIAVLGDSAVGLIRPHALNDNLYHWAFASHCGEKFGTVIEMGRLADALAISPDVLVLNLGSNNTSEAWQLKPELVEPGLVDLEGLLDATDNVPCRVIVDLPSIPHPKDTPEDGKLRVELTDRINSALHASASRPGVRLVKWSERVNANRHYIFDHAHPTPAGINAMINTIIEASQSCFAGPAPSNLQAVFEDGGDFVSWDRVASAGTSYYVEASDGRSFTTADTALIFPHKAKDVILRYRVTALSGATVSAPSAWVTSADESTGALGSPQGILAVLLIVLGYLAGVAMLADFVPVVDERRFRWLVVHDVGLVLNAIGWLLLGYRALAGVSIAWLAAATAWYLWPSRDRVDPAPPSAPVGADPAATREREKQPA